MDTFRPDPDELAAALTEMERIHEQERREAVREIEDRERRRFRPFVWVVTEGGAHSFLTAIGERQVKTLCFPDEFDRLPAPERLAAVQRRVREHYGRTTGKYIGFGKILRYQDCDPSVYGTAAASDIASVWFTVMVAGALMSRPNLPFGTMAHTNRRHPQLNY